MATHQGIPHPGTRRFVVALALLAGAPVPAAATGSAAELIELLEGAPPAGARSTRTLTLRERIEEDARAAGSSWSPVFAPAPGGLGAVSSVNALTPFAGGLAVGGDFWTVGGTPASRVALWDGSAWQPLGGGVACRVFAMVEYNGELIAGGSTVSGLNLFAWDGATWRSIRPSPPGSIYALEVFGGQLIAGGAFGVRQWNGSAWSRLDVGLDGTATALEVHQSNLFVGGHFSRAGGISSPYLARWNGTAWSSVGGPNSWVTALYSRNDSLYVGGDFRTINGSAANHIALWTTTWRVGAMGVGVNGTVLSIATAGTGLAVGGAFTRTGAGAPVPYTAHWENGAWSSYGTGLGGSLYEPAARAVQEFGGALYAGGWFQTAGGVASNFIGRWDGALPPTPVSGRIADGARPAGASGALCASANPVSGEAVTLRLSGARPGGGADGVTIVNVLGQRVAHLPLGGADAVRWTLRSDGTGRRVPAGVYYARIAGGEPLSLVVAR